MRSHRRVLTALRAVYFVLIAALAVRSWVAGSFSPALPVILGAYFVTLVAMGWERAASFAKERVQGALVLFDLSVLVVALACLREYRQDLILAMFLVVILASASRRLSVSLACYAAIAFAYVWFSSQGGDIKAVLLAHAPRLVALFVVAIYVGYLSEALARETSLRVAAEERLRRELAGLRRGQDLASGLTTAMDPSQLLPMLAENAASLVGADAFGLFWRTAGEEAFRIEPPASTLGAMDRSRIEDCLRRAAPAVDGATILMPIAASASGLEGVFVASWSSPASSRATEREALEVVARTGSVLLENAALRGLLSRARDEWQGAFQSIPVPVAIVDESDRIVQANDAFLRLSGSDPLSLAERTLPEFFEVPVAGEGRADGVELPKLGGKFDVLCAAYGSPSGARRTWTFSPTTSEAPASSSRSS